MIAMYAYGGWGKPICTLVPWRQGFRHPTRNECIGWFAQLLCGGHTRSKILVLEWRSVGRGKKPLWSWHALNFQELHFKVAPSFIRYETHVFNYDPKRRFGKAENFQFQSEFMPLKVKHMSRPNLFFHGPPISVHSRNRGNVVGYLYYQDGPMLGKQGASPMTILSFFKFTLGPLTSVA